MLNTKNKNNGNVNQQFDNSNSITLTQLLNQNRHLSVSTLITMLDNNSNYWFTTVTNKRQFSSFSSTSTSGIPIFTHSQKTNKKTQTFQNDVPNINTTQNYISQHNIDSFGNNNVFKPPPPIFVRGVINYLDLCAATNRANRCGQFFCKVSADRLKIQTSNPDSYRALVHYLKH